MNPKNTGCLQIYFDITISVYTILYIEGGFIFSTKGEIHTIHLLLIFHLMLMWFLKISKQYGNLHENFHFNRSLNQVS